MAYKDECKKVNPSVTLGAFFVKGVSVVLENFPNLNSRMEGMEMIIYDDINVGVAMSIDEDLMVCVVHRTQDKDVITISSEMQGVQRENEKQAIEQ